MGLFDGFKGGDTAAPMGIRNAIKEELDRNDWNYEITDEKEDDRQETYFYMRNELENDEPIPLCEVLPRQRSGCRSRHRSAARHSRGGVPTGQRDGDDGGRHACRGEGLR